MVSTGERTSEPRGSRKGHELRGFQGQTGPKQRSHLNEDPAARVCVVRGQNQGQSARWTEVRSPRER